MQRDMICLHLQCFTVTPVLQMLTDWGAFHTVFRFLFSQRHYSVWTFLFVHVHVLLCTLLYACIICNRTHYCQYVRGGLDWVEYQTRSDETAQFADTDIEALLWGCYSVKEVPYFVQILLSRRMGFRDDGCRIDSGIWGGYSEGCCVVSRMMWIAFYICRHLNTSVREAWTGRSPSLLTKKMSISLD